MTHITLSMVVALVAGCSGGSGWEHPQAEPPRAGPERACTDDGATIRCEHIVSRFRDGRVSRRVRWQLPPGEPPEAGWPAVVVFQGTGHGSIHSFEAAVDDAWGGWWQARLTASLLDEGFAVIAPATRLDATWWDTNVLPWAYTWDRSRDHLLVQGLLDGVDAGELGPLDPGSLFATGISSGGYMSSRMALSYPGAFRALAIQSASWATCGGVACALPVALPADHPPTLFLHGEQDEVVPVDTMWLYQEALEAQGTPTEVIVEPEVHHGWLEDAPVAIPDWFVAER